MNIRYNKENGIVCIIYCLLFIPFLMPQYFNTVVTGANKWTYLLRMLAVALGLFYVVKKREMILRNDYKMICITGILFGLGLTLSEISRGELIAFRFAVFYAACAVLICFCLSDRPLLCLNALLYIMGLYNVLQVLTVFFYYPGGVNHYLSSNIRWTKAGAVYFLGGKNQMVFYMLFFMFCVALKSLLIKKKLPKRVFLYAFLFIAESYILDSSTSVVCLVLWLGLYFLLYVNWNQKMPVLFHPYIYFLGCIAILFMLCVWTYATSSETLSTILKSMGRDITFTGRTLIWEQALQQFYHAPLVGSGDVGYYITGQITHQAHNEYLNILSKYGLAGFAPFLTMAVIAVHAIRNVRYSQTNTLCSITFLIIMLRSCFDYTDHYIYIFLMCIFIYMGTLKEWQGITNE